MQKVIQLIKLFAQSNAISFGSGFIEEINSQKAELPLLWLEPIELTDKKGQKEGELSYKITIKLIGKNKNFSQQKKEMLWQDMLSAAIKLYDTLAQDKNCARTRNLKSTPTKTAYTNYSEIGVETSFEIDILY